MYTHVGYAGAPSTIYCSKLDGPSEEEWSKYFDKLVEVACRAEYKRVCDLITDAQRYPYTLEKILGVLSTKEQVCGIPTEPLVMHDLLLHASVSGLYAEAPSHWRRIKKASPVIRDALKQMTWPKFVDYNGTCEHFLKHDAFECRFDDWRSYVDVGTDDERTKTLARFRSVQHGLLSVGLKIHCTEGVPQNAEDVLTRSVFRAGGSKEAYKLPAVGSAEAAIEILRIVGDRCGVSFTNNPEFQLQVCSPGRLDQKHCAILGTLFYLGSERLRRYKESEFVTTHHGDTSKRLIIYDAGILDGSFDYWWLEHERGVVRPVGEKCSGRTDVLTCMTENDIRNVNLIATLLLHAQVGGFFESLGKMFVHDATHLFEEHQLSHVLAADWVYQSGKNRGQKNKDFFSSLDDLMSYALSEAERLNKALALGDARAARQGILFSVRQLLAEYRSLVIKMSEGGYEA